ncbi:MAG: TolC family protein [Bdellovibrionales bacterium]|nr:TolC family protein [Bdellovibrionales bacterium]
MRCLLVLIICFSLQSQAKAASQSLSLKQALQIAYKQNLDLVLANYDFEANSINFRNEWRNFFLPKINLTLESNTALTLGAYPGTPASTTLPAGRSTGYPAGSNGASATLSLGEYTVFNFFKDRIRYDIARLTFTRNTQKLAEIKRNITFGIIAKYFEARLNQEKLQAAEKSLQIAKSIVRLVRSRVAIGQATPTELSSVEVDTNSAALQVNTLQSELETKLLDLNAALNQNSSERFILTTPLSYTPMKLSFTEAFGWFKENSPTIRDAKLGLESARGALEIAEKDLMPLPKVTLSGQAVTYGNRYGGGGTSLNPATDPLDLRAIVALNIPILGPGGLFNKDNLRLTQITLDQNEVRMQQTLIANEISIRAAVFQLQQLEDRLKTQKESLVASASLLEKTMMEASGQKTNRLELRDALDKARSNELEYLQGIFSYVQAKNAFYNLIGKDLEPE